MDALFWMLGIDALIIGMVFFLVKLRRKALMELERVLVQNRDVDLYLKLLDNPRLRLLFSRKALDALRSEGRKLI